MPCPEVQYFLDGSVECHHIAGDTHYYFMEMCANTDEVFDDYSHAGADEAFDRHWERLADMGLYMEDRYIDWRAAHPGERLIPSFMGLRSVEPLLVNLSRDAAQTLVDEGHETFNREARAYIHRRFGFNDSMDLLRRTLNRGAADFAGWDVARLTEVQRALEGLDADRRQARAALIAELRGADEEFYDYAIKSDDRKNAQRIIRERRAKQRKAIKRSVRFLSKLIGEEKTRVFIGGDMLRIEGRHAIYELHKESKLTDPHGGFRALKVFDKDLPDLHLCDVCVYTDKVPLLDHVASIVMHIRADMEEELLMKGNARNMTDAAYEREWLKPHLPAKYVPAERGGVVIDDVMDEPLAGDVRIPRIVIPGWEYRVDLPKPRRAELIAKMRKQIGRIMYEEVMAPHMPLIRACSQAVLFAPAARWEYCVEAGQMNLIAPIDELGIETLPTPILT